MNPTSTCRPSSSRSRQRTRRSGTALISSPSRSTTCSGSSESATWRSSTRCGSTGRRARKEPNPTGIGAGNHVKFYAYLFTPRADLGQRKLPLLVLPHGGVHADFTTYYAHIVRELIAQGYIVVAPEYRGSTGYGKGFYERIDYGGREVDDALAARDWASTTTRGSTRIGSASSAGATAA